MKSLKLNPNLIGLLVVGALIGALYAFGLVHPDLSHSILFGALGMTQMTGAGARVIDPVLSEIAQGYKNAELVGMNLFPYVPVGARGGRVISFNPEDFRAYNTGRAPGANTKRVQYGYASNNFALSSYSLEGMVPYELMQEAEAVPGIDLGAGAIRKTQNIIALQLEMAQAGLATTAGNYAASNKTTLAGTSQWSDFSGVSDPTKDIETAKDAIRSKIGKRPNTIIVGAAVYKSLRIHPKVIDRVKYTGRDTPTPELLASMFGVQRVLIGDAIYQDDAGNMNDVWGKNVVVAYTELGSVADMGAPSFGYTYRLRGYPIAEPAYQDRNAKSWIYPVTDEVSPVIAGASGGFLISAAVA